VTRRHGRFVAAVIVTVASTMAASAAAAQGIAAAAPAEARYVFRLTPETRTLSRHIIVDRTTVLSVVLTARPAPPLHVVLIAPDGRRIPVGSPATVRGSGYAAAVKDPPPGRWTIQITPVDTLETAIDAVVVCTFDNSVRLALSGAGDTYSSGRPIRLALALFDGAKRNDALAIHARLIPEGDESVDAIEVSFTDDGEGADEAERDGVYEAFVELEKSGTFRLEIDAAGTASTGAFRRSAAGLLRVVPRTAEITGFTSYGVDRDQDGRLDELVVSPVAMILDGDDYLVTVRLRGSNGRAIERSAQTAFGVGISSADVVFDAEDLVGEIGVDGPYHVEEIAFVHEAEGGETPGDVRRGAGDTDAFAIASLRQPLVRLTGDGSATGVDTAGDGLFSRLDVTVGVVADVAGAYSFSASLTDASGRELGFAAGSDILEAGRSSITLAIPGVAIGESGIDGPYCVSNLVLFGAGQSIVAGQALRTGCFSASQFEGSAGAGVAARTRLAFETGGCSPANRSTFSPAVEALFAPPRRAIGNGQPRP
jgi:hypothetical protein